VRVAAEEAFRLPLERHCIEFPAGFHSLSNMPDRGILQANSKHEGFGNPLGKRRIQSGLRLLSQLRAGFALRGPSEIQFGCAPQPRGFESSGPVW